MTFAARGVVFVNREQPCVFALRAGVRLQRNGGETGDLRQPVLQLLAHHAIANRLLVRRERMQPGELRPRNWKHLRGRVQLHRARAERDHRMAERKIARLEPAQIAQHFRLGVVRVENRMGQEFRGAGGELRNAEGRAVALLGEIVRVIAAENREQIFQVAFAGCFIDGNADSVLA